MLNRHDPDFHINLVNRLLKDLGIKFYDIIFDADWREVRAKLMDQNQYSPEERTNLLHLSLLKFYGDLIKGFRYHIYENNINFRLSNGNAEEPTARENIETQFPFDLAVALKQAISQKPSPLGVAILDSKLQPCERIKISIQDLREIRKLISENPTILNIGGINLHIDVSNEAIRGHEWQKIIKESWQLQKEIEEHLENNHIKYYENYEKSQRQSAKAASVAMEISSSAAATNTDEEGKLKRHKYAEAASQLGDVINQMAFGSDNPENKERAENTGFLSKKRRDEFSKTKFFENSVKDKVKERDKNKPQVDPARANKIKK